MEAEIIAKGLSHRKQRGQIFANGRQIRSHFSQLIFLFSVLCFGLLYALHFLQLDSICRKALTLNSVNTTNVMLSNSFIFSLANPRIQEVQSNSSCILVACYSYGTPGSTYFWEYYSRQGYTLVMTAFDYVIVNNRRTAANWCRICAIQNAMKKFPYARVVYIDIDTLADVKLWCNMPHLSEHAPIIMTSLYRETPYKTDKYMVYGTQIQSNLFVVHPGTVGLNAMKRWGNLYGKYKLEDQGAIHFQEGELCGIPGWIHCHRNTQQQNCHCSGSFRHNSTAKEFCIKRLFLGQRLHCDLSVS